ncbi:hypothetical protein [Rhodoferax mekongensis]|uniref:Uncharacterized protein n=1 Tax=Rhodoferax mekongensis TaxID=3068341 RepID=A0ABZ0B5A2_9BURK|nr:hypothetical protein [Rhodoferax sp. TBRC 17307]WNO06047.1 hypothetical protein RAN89_06350 [Rhodoferax sp. TBRC 17307]
MPYTIVLNNRSALTASEAQDMNREFDLLRAELDDMRTKNAALLTDISDIRTKYTALVALLVAGTALGAGYSTGTGLAGQTVTALGQRRFTPN